MTAQELEYQVKVRLDQKVVLVEIYIYSYLLIIMTSLKELMRIYTTNYLFLLQMLHLEPLLKFHRLMEVNLKSKFQLVHNMVNNSD